MPGSVAVSFEPMDTDPDTGLPVPRPFEVS
jgi:hypothetical protein